MDYKTLYFLLLCLLGVVTARTTFERQIAFNDLEDNEIPLDTEHQIEEELRKLSPRDKELRLIDAANYGNETVLRILLTMRTNVNAQDGYLQTALHRAVFTARKEIAEILLDNGADTEIRDYDSNTPLHLANGKEFSWEVVRLLLQRGARVNARGQLGRTALHWAADFGDLKSVQILLQYGADQNVVDNKGWKPLDIATFVGNENVSQWLTTSRR